MALKCLGCGKDDFNSTRAHSIHIKSCQKSGRSLGATIREQNAVAASKRDSKTRRQHIQELEEQATSAPFDPVAEVIVPEEPPQPDPSTLSRVGRVRRVPAKLRDLLPTSYTGLPAHIRLEHPAPVRAATPLQAFVVDSTPQPECDEAASAPARSPSPPKPSHFRTVPDEFGLYRLYSVIPQRDPGGDLAFHSSCDPLVFDAPAAAFPSVPAGQERVPPGLEKVAAPPYAPFPNVSTFDLVYWQSHGSNLKSYTEVNTLAQLMQEPDFDPRDVARLDAAREVARLDEYCEDAQGSPFNSDDRWIKGAVKIRLPKEGVRYDSEENAPEFTVEEVYYRPILDVISSACQQSYVRNWNFIPYKLFWLNETSDDMESQPSGSTSQISSGAAPCRSDDSQGPQPRAAPSGSIPSTPPIPQASPTTPSVSSKSPAPLQPPRRLSSPSSSSSSSGSSSTSAGEDVDEGIRVYSEVWHADAWLEEDAKMRAQPRQVGDPDDMEYAILPLKLYSDSTHLTAFSSASLWPIYMYFLAQSKYERGRPTAFSAHHLAYVPSLPDTLQDAYIKLYGIAATAAILTFLKRELMQAIWLLLLDDRFMYAYVHGLVLLCGDNVLRRLFIRFFIYAADYPEKILLACLKYFALCPCPRCRINKDRIIEMGTMNDLHRRNWVRQDDEDLRYRIKMTRRWIFEDGISLNSKYIARVLDPLSITPTRSAFSVRLREYGFNFYSLFVPDLMHEFELGTWKSIWVHLLRILYAAGEDLIQELNRRFRQVPTFGRCTIRRFSANISGQGKLAARDYEGRLKCFMATFEGLLAIAANNKIVLDLVFNLSTWHALAKLREHTDMTLDGLDDKTVDCGRSVREFAKKTCADYETYELPSKDSAARGRRRAAMTAKGQDAASQSTRKTSSVRKLKHFNYMTYKFHAMRDYAPAIRLVASGDNFTTQTGELEHRHVKKFYARTNHIGAAFQIAQHMRRAEKLRIIKTRVEAMRAARRRALERTSDSDCAAGSLSGVMTPPDSGPQAADTLPFTNDPLARYHIADSQREWDDITTWASSNAEDPALEGFMRKLKDHLLSRLLRPSEANTPTPSEYNAADRSRLALRNNRVYWHRVLRVNYTTYDRQRTQDSINPRTHPDILLLSQDPRTHPYLYARVLRVFHVNARVLSSDADNFEPVYVLWVRWFRIDSTFEGGFEARRLHRVEFVPVGCADDAFGFVDPADVIRGAHLIPAFAHGRTKELLGPSIARDGPTSGKARSRLQPSDSSKNSDFKFYYVNFFVDRDMFMRYYGGGIGHQGLRSVSRTAVDEGTFDSDSEWQDIDDDEPEGPPETAQPECSTLDSLKDALDDPEQLIEEQAAALLCEEDVLRLVPELALAQRELLPPDEEVSDNLIGEEDEDEAELTAHAELQAELEEEGSAHGADGWESDEEDNEEDEYSMEGYAPL
ncbi:hypothetical protein OH77DRAFT_1490928 [Trametes cingulata]|nr:hypothetical protein OH77DRAFT_1490928 [Trametes cingulata]